MSRHLLVTNDFPPKTGGIQQYLWELWRRLDARDVTVLTTPYEGAHEFDAKQAFRVQRTKQKWLLPTRALVRQIDEFAEEVDAEFVVLDPAMPLGVLGPRLSLPYVLVGHGAEYVIPSRLPVTRGIVRNISRRASGLIASGEYVGGFMAHSAGDGVPMTVVPPGVDVERFVPLIPSEREAVRRRWGVRQDATFVLGVSRLVPRKGFDRLIDAAAVIAEVDVLIAGKGREMGRLQERIRMRGAPVRLLGRVDDDDLAKLYGAADIFVMPCHDRWLGLEQEGYGIVFAEAASAGVPSIAGNSGGSGEAVVDGETGFVVSSGAGSSEIARAIRQLLDPAVRSRMGEAAGLRARREQSYDHLASKLDGFLDHLSEQLR